MKERIQISISLALPSTMTLDAERKKSKSNDYYITYELLGRYRVHVYLPQ